MWIGSSPQAVPGSARELQVLQLWWKPRGKRLQLPNHPTSEDGRQDCGDVDKLNAPVNLHPFGAGANYEQRLTTTTTKDSSTGLVIRISGFGRGSNAQHATWRRHNTQRRRQLQRANPTSVDAPTNTRATTHTAHNNADICAGLVFIVDGLFTAADPTSDGYPLDCQGRRQHCSSRKHASAP